MGLFNKKEEAFAVLPKHIGIIMDGNGRWAKKRGLPRTAGHKKGANVFRGIAEDCADLGIEYVTFYCFSSENWKRPQKEVDAIMDLFRDYLIEAEERQKESKNIKVKFIGERDGLREDLLELMDRAEANTASHNGTTINLAINYGGRQEIAHAVREVAKKVLMEEKSVKDITEDDISAHLYTAGQHDPDLIIRPSGEQRLSNFMIWQAAYSEFWYSDVLWPDFTKKDLYEALRAYESRNRRFGG